MKVLFPLILGLFALVLAVFPDASTALFQYKATLWPRVALGGAAFYLLIAAYGALRSCALFSEHEID